MKSENNKAALSYKMRDVAVSFGAGADPSPLQKRKDSEEEESKDFKLIDQNKKEKKESVVSIKDINEISKDKTPASPATA